ncbi:MAG TPA: glycosyltransferase family 2 protein [Chitinophagaceae bacterium]|jgi:glycosyltransferase involved in cell wall biosynthesis|nr:glycosyltransferase family 2 protein [Chitinophagaceae bacterium]
MATPVISVITVVFNGEKHLEQTIRSVLDQTYSNIQYIIIDGGSTDNSLNIIKKYEKDIYYWVSEKDKGISDAFNKGIARATGDVIGIINSDDWFEPLAFERVAAQIGDADICYGDIQLWKNGRKELIQKGNLQLLNREMTIHHATVFVKRKIYETYGCFDLQYRCAMDYDLLLRFKVKNCRFAYIPEVLSNMRWGGFSDEFWKIGCRETLDIKNKYLPEKRLSNRLYYFKHLAAIRMAKTLSHLNLEFITRIYRKLSPIKKIYND